MSRDEDRDTDDTPVRQGIGIIVPAYNEEETILDSIPSFLGLDHPNKEIIVVNDGSTDETITRLQTEYGLVEVNEQPSDLPCEPIRAVYRSRIHESLWVLDKENGGKSDALNAGIWFTDKPLFCAVDSDTVIEAGALSDLAEPFVDRPHQTVATGGTVRVANGCEFEDGELKQIELSSHSLVSLQALEYLRAFYLGRLGLSRLKALLLISGAFGLFRTEAVQSIGGFREDTITEDFELVIRLHKHLIQRDEQYRIEYIPDATAWTEVPETRTVLSRQRRRWFRGMIETLISHRDMIGNSRYGVVGMYALPFYVLAEFLGPLLEGLGFILLPAAYAFEMVDLMFFGLFVFVTSGLGAVLSWYAVIGEYLTDHEYVRLREIGRLLIDGIVENVGYRQWKTLLAWQAVAEYLQGSTEWGDMEREGLE